MMKKIHINPKNKGKFNATKKATGKSTEELTHSKNPITRKRAIFSQNAAKWRKEYGGHIPKADIGLKNPYPQNNLNLQQSYHSASLFGVPQKYTFGVPQGYTFGVPQGYTQPYTPQQQQATDVGFKIDYNDPSLGFVDIVPEGQNNINNQYYDPTLYSQSNNQPYTPQQQAAQAAQGNNQPMTNTNHTNNLSFGFPNFAPSSNKYFQRGAFFTNAALAGINNIKGTMDFLGDVSQNRRVFSQEQKAQAFSKRASMYNPTPPDTEYNRNPTPFEAGGINDFKTSPQGANVEVEGGEHIKLPMGLSGSIQGASHAQGGIPMNLPQDSIVFSEKLEHPEEGKSYAKLAKKYSTEKDFKNLNSKYSDKLNKSTAELNIKLKNEALNDIFMEQEQNKIMGKHGAKVQANTIAQLEDTNMMAMGGSINKYPVGGKTKGFTRYSPETQKLIDEGKLIPAPNVDPLNTVQHKSKLGIYGNTEKPEYDMEEFYTRHPWVKTEFKKATGREFNPSNPQDTKWFQTTYDKFYNDATGQHYFQDQKNTPYGFDSKFGKHTYSAPIIPVTTEWEGKQGNRPSVQYDKTAPYIITNKYTQPDTDPQVTKKGDNLLDEPNLNINKTPTNPSGIDFSYSQFPLIANSNYSRLPITTSVLTPEYINPRYLDIQPQLNQVTRGYRTFQSNLGSRASTDVANLLQGQANVYDQNQQIYGTKYNYDRQQDAEAQKFNAEAKMKTNLYNQAELNNFRKSIADREAAIQEQKIYDADANMKLANQQRAYEQQKKFIADTFTPYDTQQPFYYNPGLLPENIYDNSKTSTQVKTKEGNATTTPTTTPKEKKLGGRIKLPKKLK